MKDACRMAFGRRKQEAAQNSSASGDILSPAAPGQVAWVTEGQHHSRGTGGEAAKPGGEGRRTHQVEIIIVYHFSLIGRTQGARAIRRAGGELGVSAAH